MKRFLRNRKDNSMDPSRLDGGLFDPANDDDVDLDALAERGDLDAALWAEREEEGNDK